MLASAFTSGIQIGTGIATLVLGFFTFQLASKTAKMVSATEIVAETSIQQADIALRALQAANRPWLTAASPDLGR